MFNLLSLVCLVGITCPTQLESSATILFEIKKKLPGCAAGAGGMNQEAAMMPDTNHRNEEQNSIQPAHLR